jgi:hypothetical protein
MSGLTNNSVDVLWETYPANPEVFRQATEQLFAIYNEHLDKKDCGEEENNKLRPIVKAFVAGNNMLTNFKVNKTWDYVRAAKLAKDIAKCLTLAKKLQHIRAVCPDKKAKKQKVPDEIEKGTPILTGIRSLPDLDDMPVVPIMHIVNTPKGHSLGRRNSLGAVDKKGSLTKITSRFRRGSSSASHKLKQPKYFTIIV